MRARFPVLPKSREAYTLTHIVRDVARLVILFVGMTMILSEGVDLKPVLAAAGLGGLAIGSRGPKSGEGSDFWIFILWEDSVRVGDVVEVAGVAGLVEEVELRTIKLRDVSGNPCGPQWVIEKVKNLTKDYSYYVFEIGVAYRENVDAVMGSAEIAEDLRRILGLRMIFWSRWRCWAWTNYGLCRDDQVSHQDRAPQTMADWSGDESSDQEHVRCQRDRTPDPVPAKLLGRAQEGDAATYIGC
jgi:hypothetical protein